jgi:hypothetical protein
MSNVFPISFCIDEDKIVKTIVKNKSTAFSSLIPGDFSTYTFNSEEEYNKHYSDCFYAFTWKKGGWDCMRHYEIIAAGCMPFFIDLSSCPENTMKNFPKSLVLEAMQLPGFDIHTRTIDMNIFPIDKYYELLDKVVDHAKQHLTSRVVAKTVLDICNFDYSENSKTKLVYYNFYIPDYQSLMILQGLKRLLGKRCISTPNDDYMYDDFPEEKCKNIYGKGFNYSRILPAHLRTSQDEFNQMLLDPKDDITLVMFGKCHLESEPHHLLQTKEKVLLCGEDLHHCHFIHDHNRSSKLFVREL